MSECHRADREGTSVEVELRTWNANVLGAKTTFYGVGEPARLARDERGFVVVLRETEAGEEVVGMNELRGVIMVRTRPSPEQAGLLVSAVEAGYMVEPRIAGDPWPSMQDEEGEEVDG